MILRQLARRHRGVAAAVGFTLATALLGSGFATGGPPAAEARPRSGLPPGVYYLSLGNSLAQGFQPIGGPHTNEPAAGYRQGYPEQLLKLLRDGGRPRLRLVEMGCGGESTATMIAASRCRRDTGSQLGDAVEFLDAHPGEVALVTIDIGSNDIVLDCDADLACAFGQIATNLPVILATLRQHAGPDVPIVGMNYYSPFVTEWFGDPALGQAAATLAVVFNDLLEGIYAAAGVPVADVETAFAVTDFTTIVELRRVGPVPLSVHNACTLTWMCAPPPRGPDIHANTRGHAVIAEAFATVLGA